MPPSKFTSFIAASVAIVVSAIAVGCGGGGGGGSTTPTTSSGRSATIGVASGTNLGSIIVNSQGRTVYLFRKDSGTKSSCFKQCAAQWPPLRSASRPVGGTGLTVSEIGTAGRPDGGRQVTYNGHPLYLFGGDQKPGDTNGQGINAFGASWFALSPSGRMVRGAGSGGGIGY
jgi:predicted lipoprotein with Yx(FWY)xxD motif